MRINAHSVEGLALEFADAIAGFTRLGIRKAFLESVSLARVPNRLMEHDTLCGKLHPRASMDPGIPLTQICILI